MQQTADEFNMNSNEFDIKRKPTALMNRQVKPFRPTAHHDAGVEIVHKICHNSCGPQHLKSLFWLQIWSSAFTFESMRSKELGGGMLFFLSLKGQDWFIVR